MVGAIRVSVVLGALALSGCGYLTAILGVGGSVVANELDQVERRTFAKPVELVSAIVVSALVELGMEVEALDRTGSQQYIRAASDSRTVRVALEPVSPQATWVSVTAHEALDVDAATARWVLRRAAEILDSAAS